VPAPAPPVPAPAPAARLELHLEVGRPGTSPPIPLTTKREHSRWSPSPPPSPQWEYKREEAPSPVAPPSPPVIVAAPAAAASLANAPWHELGLDERLGLAVSGLDAATWDSSYMAGSDPRVVRPMEVRKPAIGPYAQGAPPPKPRESIASRAVRSLKETERPFARRAAAASGGGGGPEAGGGQGSAAGAEGMPRDVPRHPKPRAASASASKRDTADKAAARARQAKEFQLAQKAASDVVLIAAAAARENPAAAAAAAAAVAAAAAAATVPVKDDRVKLSTRAGVLPVKGALPQLSQSAAVLSQPPKSVIGAASAAVYGVLRPKRGPAHRTPARAASAAALGPRTPPCNENTAALIHAFTRGALAGDRLGERSQLVRRLESEALAMAKGAPRRPVTAPSLGSLGGSPAL
jgi:hypothetical protein